MEKFEVYDRKLKRSDPHPLVTLQASGAFSMNERAFELLGHPDQIELLFNAEGEQVGFHAASEDSPYGYPIREQPNSKNFQTAGRGFCRHHGIQTGQARRFAAELHDDVLVIGLERPEHVLAGRRGTQGGGGE